MQLPYTLTTHGQADGSTNEPPVNATDATPSVGSAAPATPHPEIGVASNTGTHHWAIGLMNNC